MSDNLRHNENSTIFIGGISHNTTVNELKEIFKPFGHVTSLTLKNRYAFLVYEDPHDAMDAIRDLDGRVVNGVTMNVQMADTEFVFLCVVSDDVVWRVCVEWVGFVGLWVWVCCVG
eukprot:TRINITY_DN1597_c0_g1_i2.p2 TRINITY_DN1597_c0_g1~~TRINITY_DN1597_c0_g1_i2.p2  ORF type:complete len:116 (+),score=18.20 TRINITY_DN1597_c0_g1_i2:306-653(+)